MNSENNLMVPLDKLGEAGGVTIPTLLVASGEVEQQQRALPSAPAPVSALRIKW